MQGGATGKTDRYTNLEKELIMKSLIQVVRNFVREEEGATAIEYGLLAALVAVVIIAAVEELGGSLQKTFQDVAAKLTPAP
jgi:pilus assembly protein Flp/PilA